MSQLKPKTNFSESASLDEVPIDSSVDSESSRRAALKKIGRFTTYMAPVMLGLISQNAATAS